MMSIDISYQRPDLKAIQDQLRRDRLRIRLALTADSAAKALTDVIEIWKNHCELKEKVRLLHKRQPSDAFWTEEQEWLIRVDTGIQISLMSIDQTIQNSRHLAELTERFSLIFPIVSPQTAALFSERLREDLTIEQITGSRTWDMFLNSRVYCIGQTWSLMGLRDLLTSPQRSIRRAALRGLNDWINLQGEQLDQYFSDLLKKRQFIIQKARLSEGWPEISLQGQIPLTADVRQNWQKLVLTYLVPMSCEIRRLQRRRLNLEFLQDYDLLCFLQNGMPPDRVPVSAQHIETSLFVPLNYHSVSHDLLPAGFFKYLEMLDTIHRPSDLELDDELIRLLTLTRWIIWLVWLTAADDFTSQVCSNTIEDFSMRRNLWLVVERQYFPDLHHDQMPAFAAGGLMYLTINDWIHPGHNLSDAFALTSALSFWYRHKKNKELFNTNREKLKSMSNNKLFSEILSDAKLNTPWDDTQFKQLMFALVSDLDL